MAADEVSVIALVENLELLVPRRLPARLLHSQDRAQQQQQQQQQQRSQAQVTRIIELSDRDSKMALKRQLNLDLDTGDELAGKNVEASESEEQESLEILRRLPPGTVLIKQVETKNPQKDEEERTTEETSSERPRKLSQRIRNKKTLEVRRNPMRSAARKELGKEGRVGATPRQRLLGTRRRAVTGSEQGTRRPRPTAYMNTRSVTRKMYNVGATYEAPTRRDETEWKEWPVHGMHERPVYHPQNFGLAEQQHQQQHQQQQQFEQMRKFERLQQFESSLQRLGQRVCPQGADGYQQKFATSRLLLRPKEMLRSLRGVTLAHAHPPNQPNPSKCLIMPRAATAPVALPFCGVQAVKGNPKGIITACVTTCGPTPPMLETTITDRPRVLYIIYNKVTQLSAPCKSAKECSGVDKTNDCHLVNDTVPRKYSYRC